MQGIPNNIKSQIGQINYLIPRAECSPIIKLFTCFMWNFDQVFKTANHAMRLCDIIKLKQASDSVIAFQSSV